MGSYPFTKDARTFGTNLVLRSTQPELLATAFAGLKGKLKAKGIL